MTAKEYMKQAQRLLRRIDRKQKEADALRQKLSFPKSPAYSDLPKPVSPESHAVESGVSQILSLEEEVKTAKKELEDLKAVFDTAIKAVTDTEHHDIQSVIWNSRTGIRSQKKWDTVNLPVIVCTGKPWQG